MSVFTLFRNRLADAPRRLGLLASALAAGPVLMMAGAAAEASPIRNALCVVEDVAIFDNRVHIRCNYDTLITVNWSQIAANKSSNHPRFFSVRLTSPMAGPLVAMATTMSVMNGMRNSGYFAKGDYFENSGPSPWDTGVMNIRTAQEYTYLLVNYDYGDLSGSSFGCLTQDCRIPRSITKVINPFQGD